MAQDHRKLHRQEGESAKKIAIFGCGPSLLTTDIESIQRTMPSMALNSAIELVKSPTYHCAMDRRFLANYPEYWTQLPNTICFISKNIRKNMTVTPVNIPVNICVFTPIIPNNRRKTQDILTELTEQDQDIDNLELVDAPAVLPFAIQICMALKYSTIELYGIDWDYTHGRATQKHDPCKGKLKSATAWMEKFKNCKPESVTVVNKTPGSKLVFDTAKPL